MEVPTEIIAKYVERRRHDLEVCLSFVERQQYKEIEKIAHQLKGNGCTFGYPELSNIGKRLEIAARAKDAKIVEASLVELSKWVNLLH
jgi:HPt (histidine-containing phosphotransfer) domain-containing protein